MGSRTRDVPPGYGKLLDAWTPPQDAGDPVAVLATSFTFAPAFFEEECLARFLRLQSDPQEDGAAYLIEREEKLAQTQCVAVMVDRQHCRGSRNLRWDLLPAHVPGAVLHAKVALLFWSRRLRLIVTSANLTEDGYRRNLEVFGVVDFHAGSPAPRAVLEAAIGFLRDVTQYARRDEGEPGPALRRWQAVLDRMARVPDDWSRDWKKRVRHGWGVAFVGVGPGRLDALSQLEQAWGVPRPPEVAHVVSPFFDPPDATNEPARRLWALLRQRGPAEVTWAVTAEDIPGEPAVFVHAPQSLLEAQPKSRAAVATHIERVELPANRPLHAKAIWIEHDHRAAYMIGSSNFTSPGLGLGPRPNVEANLVYLVRRGVGRRGYGRLRDTLPPSRPIEPEIEIRWQPRIEEHGEADVAAPALPDGFGDAVFDCEASGQGVVTLMLGPSLPAGWVVLREDADQCVLDETAWKRAGKPRRVRRTWDPQRPPSGFRVRWAGVEGFAWWPVQAKSAEVLPPPSELRALPLEMLVDVLTSALPLHKVLARHRKRKARRGSADADGVGVDPILRVDVSRFLLRRTRRVGWALAALRERLERPAVSEAALHWRLRGPVGVLALADALEREAHSDDEAAFLLCELALELSRVRPRSGPGCVPANRVRDELKRLIAELRARVSQGREPVAESLRTYVNEVFAEVAG